MAKKSRINRNDRIERISKKAESKRIALKEKIKTLPAESSADYQERFKQAFVAMLGIQKMDRNGSKTRHRKRCFVTGRPRGITKIGIERNKLREFSLFGLLPGMTKSSW